MKSFSEVLQMPHKILVGVKKTKKTYLWVQNSCIATLGLTESADGRNTLHSSFIRLYKGSNKFSNNKRKRSLRISAINRCIAIVILIHNFVLLIMCDKFLFHTSVKLNAHCLI